MEFEMPLELEVYPFSPGRLCLSMLLILGSG